MTAPVKFTSPAVAAPPSLRDGSTRKDLELQMAETLSLPEGLAEDAIAARVWAAADMLDRLAPDDDTEVLLAAQMVACHHAAMTCLRRAGGSWQTPQGRNMELRNAARLMNLYCRQTEALEGRRARGRGSVAVGRVNVAAGGQAVVGHVETGGRRDPGR